MLSDPYGRSGAGGQPILVLARVDARGWNRARPIPWPGSAHRVGEASDGPPVVEAAIHHCGGIAPLVPAPSHSTASSRVAKTGTLRSIAVSENSSLTCGLSMTTAIAVPQSASAL